MAAGRDVSGELRIIGGQWRGRKLRFLAAAGVRPTADRVRETLFNWLHESITDARCLDLFAGSGALGLEALSRGAAEVVCVESSARIATALRDNLARIGADRCQVVCSEAYHFLQGEPSPFDIVFLDPPFRQGLLTPICATLASRGWLAATAHIYIESELENGLPELPTNWQVTRKRQAGQVAYHLINIG